MMNQNQSACARWDDRSMMDDLLSTEKQMASTYTVSVIEGACAPIRQMYSQNMTDTLCDQFQIFEEMQQRGWYPTKTAPQTEIQTAKQKYTQTKSQLM